MIICPLKQTVWSFNLLKNCSYIIGGRRGSSLTSAFKSRRRFHRSSVIQKSAIGSGSVKEREEVTERKVDSRFGGRGMAELAVKEEEKMAGMVRENKEVRENERWRFVDIGINLTDPVFRGEYHGTQRHENDLEDVITRAKEAGCEKLLVTGSDVEESRKAIELSKQYPGFVYNTVGVHPCSCRQFENCEGGPEKMLEELKALAIDAKRDGWCVAFGEFGLDYDRLEHCPLALQQKYFTAQLHIAATLNLPLFLHSRACATDFRALLAPHLANLPKRGVVHSFTGTEEEMLELVEDGWSIGVNGCSLKTKENCDVVAKIPLERLMLETDGPWCEIRPSHHSAQYLKNLPTPPSLPNAISLSPNPSNRKSKSKPHPQSTSTTPQTSPPENASSAPNPESPPTNPSSIAPKLAFSTFPVIKKEKWIKGSMVKGRNEPCMIGRVAWVVAEIKGVEVEVVVEAAWENSVRMFGLGERG